MLNERQEGVVAKANKKPKLCMFCGGDESLGPMNIEHFIPKGMWAGKRPDRTKTCPAHVSCNSAHSEDCDYFRTVITALEGMNEHPKVQALYKGSIGRMIHKRPNQYEKFVDDLAFRPRFTESGIYIGPHPSFRVDFNRIERALKNMGIFYTMIGRPLRSTTTISILEVTWPGDEKVNEFIECLGEWLGFGDDVFACKYSMYMPDLDRMDFALAFYRRKFYIGEATPAA